MTDIETLLRETFDDVVAPYRDLSGPSLRRLARRRRTRARAGGVAVVAAASAAVVATVPHLGSSGESGPAAATPLCMRPTTASPSERAAATPAAEDTWHRPGALINDPVIDNIATFVAAHDCDYSTDAAQLLRPGTTRIVYAGMADVDPGPRALVIVAGDLANGSTALSVLSTVAGGLDNWRFGLLTVVGVVPSAHQDALAAVWNHTVFVTADAGITRGLCTYAEDAAKTAVTAPMIVANDVATCPTTRGSRPVTRVTAYSGSAKVWDAAPETLRRVAAQ
jgi:hypothetical protein